MKKPWLWMAISALSLNAYAASQTEDLQPTMHSLATNLQTLLPLIFVPEEDLGQNVEPLKQQVAQLIDAFDKSQKHFDHDSPAFKASYRVTSDYLKQTQKYLNQGKITLASDKLKMLPSYCVSCHTQDSKQNNNFFGLEREAFSSDFQFAELSFATRDYGTAVRYFDKFLTQPGSFKSKTRTETALERLLTLYVQVDHEPAMAATYLNEYLPFIVDFPDLKLRLETWVDSLANLPVAQLNLLNGKSTLNFDNLKEVAKSLESTPFAKQDEVQVVVIRGLIHSYLNKTPKEQEIPALLYWLALADKQLNYSFYQSFAEVYLDECATNYPNSEYGPKCKKELSDYRGMA